MAATAVMPETRVESAEQRVVLHDVSWELYERLLAEVVDKPGTRFAYCDGALEIMVVYGEHESLNRFLALIVELVAGETDRDLCPCGSTTYKRPDQLKGFEPDSSFYFDQASRIRGKDTIDLLVDPPPELVLEIDISSNSLDKFPLFAAIGVREVWRYSNHRVAMYRLEDGKYRQIEESVSLPPMTAKIATQFLKESREMQYGPWLKRLREWARTAAPAQSS